MLLMSCSCQCFLWKFCKLSRSSCLGEGVCLGWPSPTSASCWASPSSCSPYWVGSLSWWELHSHASWSQACKSDQWDWSCQLGPQAEQLVQGHAPPGGQVYVALRQLVRGGGPSRVVQHARIVEDVGIPQVGHSQPCVCPDVELHHLTLGVRR